MDIKSTYKIQLEHQINGGNVKTFIINIQEISKIIERKEICIMKYFSYCLETIACYRNEKWFLTGLFSFDVLENVLNEFIQKFVLCRNCGFIKTELKTNNQKTFIIVQCTKCKFLHNINMKEKITNYFLKTCNMKIDPCDELVHQEFEIRRIIEEKEKEICPKWWTYKHFYKLFDNTNDNTFFESE